MKKVCPLRSPSTLEIVSLLCFQMNVDDVFFWHRSQFDGIRAVASREIGSRRFRLQVFAEVDVGRNRCRTVISKVNHLLMEFKHLLKLKDLKETISKLDQFEKDLKLSLKIQSIVEETQIFISKVSQYLKN